MSQPYVGEIRLVGFSFAPVGWAICDGALMPISENEVLFTLIGTTYGGDGQETFAIPDLQGRTSVHQGSNGVNTYQIGEAAGVETVTLTSNQIPVHNHGLLASGNAGNVNSPSSATLGASQPIYASFNPSVALNAQSLPTVGGSQPHENMQPFLTLNYIISLFGIFPSQT